MRGGGRCSGGGGAELSVINAQDAAAPEGGCLGVFGGGAQAGGE